MKIQRFLAGNMQKGMAIVRKELGNDAVLISTKGVDGGIEIMATDEFDGTEMKEHLAETTSRNETRSRNEITSRNEEISRNETEQKIVDDVRSVASKRFEPFDSKSSSSVYLQDMQEELARLRKLFEGELAQLTWRESGDREPNRMALLSRLDMAGFNRSLRGKMVDKILPCKDLEMAWRRIQRLLSRIIQISENDILQEGGIIVLVGSTGVGKTVTAGKIASQFAKIHGKNQVAFINADNKLIGGNGQIVSLGTSLGIPVQNVNNIDEIENTLESFSSRKLVIIDTGGLDHRDSSMIKNLQSITGLSKKIKPYLVLSATTQESMIYETIQSLSSIKIAGAIITKIDESSFVGPVLSGLIRKKLPIAFIGTGQNVLEDIIPADAEILVKAVVNSYEDSFRTNTTKVNESAVTKDSNTTSWNFVN